MGERVILSWAGEPAVLERSLLVDVEPREVIRPADPRHSGRQAVTLTAVPPAGPGAGECDGRIPAPREPSMDDRGMNTADEPILRTTPADGANAPRDAGRREALGKLGALAAWTTPGLVTLVLSERASADFSTPPPAQEWP